MNKINLTAKQMQVIMMALYNSEEFEDEAAQLHDELATEGFDRFEEKKGAVLSWKE